jgi:P2-related tail formation protein
MSVETVIPDNSDVFERALAAAMSDILPVPVREKLDPDTTSEEFLPFLAHGEAVKLWFDDWPVARKRHVAKEWLKSYASIIGTRAALEPFLALVEADLIDRISNPTYFVIGETPISDGMRVGHGPHYLTALVKASPVAEPDHFTIGVTPVDQPIRVHDIDTTALDRAKAAMRAAKAPETHYTVDFGWLRPATFDDAVPFDEARRFDALIEREKA